MSATRYEGKPMLRLLECYVINVLGVLPEKEQKNLEAMQPMLAQLYGHQGTWDQIIAATMKLPPNMPKLIHDLWEKNQAIAREHSLELAPQQFAEMFVDQNLA